MYEFGIGTRMVRMLAALMEAPDNTIKGLSSPDMYNAMTKDREGLPKVITDRRLKSPPAATIASGAASAANNLELRGLVKTGNVPNPVPHRCPYRAVTITQAGRELWAQISTPEGRAEYRKRKLDAAQQRSKMYALWNRVSNTKRKRWKAEKRRRGAPRGSGWIALIEMDELRGVWQMYFMRPDKKETGWIDMKATNAREAKREAGELLRNHAAEWARNRFKAHYVVSDQT